MRRALSHFPDQQSAETILDTYLVAGGIKPGQQFKRCALPSVRPPVSLHRLNVAASFVEVWLAKEGHDGMIGLNLLEKLQTSNLAPLYGAMLAGVDVVLMGAGVPREIPGVLDRFAEHAKAAIRITTAGSDVSRSLEMSFDPKAVFPAMERSCIKRPMFIPIISSSTLGTHLLERSTGRVDGFVVEGVPAGGHNAPPRGPMKLNVRGEPIYGRKDEADLDAIRALGLPFWLAGAYGSPGKLRDALERGATGIQVGTAFAFCEESGIDPMLRAEVIRRYAGPDRAQAEPVMTDPRASPTGFPFKVIPLPTTLSDDDVYAHRPRICDLGLLRQVVVGADGAIVYRCPAEPEDDYVRKGGRLDDTVGRRCLCNALLSNIGLGQTHDDAYQEPPLLTAGDELVHIGQFLRRKHLSYTAKDVLTHLMDDIRH